MRLKPLVTLFAVAVILAACESSPEATTDTSGQGAQTATRAPSDWTTLTRQVGDRVFFDLDQHDLKPAARKTVEAWSKWVKANPGRTVTIQGHADERGTREYNLALGDRRATSVKNYLVALGVQANRVRTISYGKERPQDPGHSQSSWAANRRGVAVVQ